MITLTESSASGVSCATAHSPYGASTELCSLVKRAQAGDLRAQNDLILAYQRRISGFVYAIMGRAAPVDDLCQEIFIKMVLGLPRLKDANLFQVWLFRLARNQCIDHSRHYRWLRLFTFLDLQTHDRAEPINEDQKEKSDALLSLMEQLPKQERALLIMAQEGLSIREMAKAAGITCTNAKTRLHRARKNLRGLYARKR